MEVPERQYSYHYGGVYRPHEQTLTRRSEAATLSRSILEAGVIEEAFLKAKMMIELPKVSVKRDIKLVTQ